MCVCVCVCVCVCLTVFVLCKNRLCVETKLKAEEGVGDDRSGYSKDNLFDFCILQIRKIKK